jgi:hypothetical protein
MAVIKVKAPRLRRDLEVDCERFRNHRRSLSERLPSGLEEFEQPRAEGHVLVRRAL